MGEIFKRAYQRISENKQRRENGLVNCLPIRFPRLSSYLIGIQQKNYTLITASSGVGKSKFTKKIFVIDVIDFIEKNPETDIDVRIKYFCLEESKERFITSIISYKLYKDHAISLSVKELESMKENYTLSDDVLRKISEMDNWFAFFEIYVEVVDNIRHPTGIFKHVEKFMETQGEWTYKEMGYDGKTVSVRDYYTPRNPQLYTIVVIDHISLVYQEKGMRNIAEAIDRLSSTYLIQLRDSYGCTVAVAQQQASDKEKQQYTFKGKSIEEKLEPSLEGLGDSKKTQRDADDVIGIFAPERYEISPHRGYDIHIMKDHYRSVSILKSRYEESNVKIGMFFHGAVGELEELPKASDITEEDYAFYLAKCGEAPVQQGFNFNNIR